MSSSIVQGPPNGEFQTMTSRLLASAAGAFLILAAGAASAQADANNPHPNKAMRQACAADLKTYCADVQPGQGRITQCMKSHADQLSAGCKSAVAEARAAHKADHEGAQTPPPAPQ
jgi:hypothetical protein